MELPITQTHLQAGATAYQSILALLEDAPDFPTYQQALARRRDHLLALLAECPSEDTLRSEELAMQISIYEAVLEWEEE